MVTLDGEWKNQSSIQSKSFGKNECIEPVGKIANGIYRIKSGVCKLIYPTSAKNFTIDVLGKNSYYGLGCLLGLPNVLSLVSMQPCNVDFIEREIAKASFKNPADLVIDYIGNSNKYLIEKVVKDSVYQADKRIIVFLLTLIKHSPNGWIDVSRKEIADFSNVSKEHAVRILASFKKDGLISLDGRHLFINANKVVKKYPELKVLV